MKCFGVGDCTDPVESANTNNIDINDEELSYELPCEQKMDGPREFPLSTWAAKLDREEIAGRDLGAWKSRIPDG